MIAVTHAGRDRLRIETRGHVLLRTSRSRMGVRTRADAD